MYGYIHMKSNADMCAAERKFEIDHAWRRAVRLDRVAEKAIIAVSENVNATDDDIEAAKVAADAAQSAHDDWAILAGVRSTSLFV